MSTTKTTTLAALVLAAGLALTACSNTPALPEPAETTPVEVTPGTGETVTPAPSETPVADGFTTGQIVTEVPADLENSQRAFPLPDGTFVIVDRYEALPEAVQAAVQAQADATVGYQAGVTDYTAIEAQTAALNQAKSDIGRATGKNVIVVYRMVGAVGCNGTGTDPWGFTGSSAQMFGGCAAWASQADALAAAQGYVNGREDANTYVIVVDNG